MKMYVLDTCVMREFLYHFRRDVPAFDRMWNVIDNMINNEELIFVKESYSELERQCSTEENLKWLKSHKKFFTAPCNDECQIVADLYRVRNFQNNVSRKNILEGIPVADAFLVARAKYLGEQAIVVSREKLKPTAAKIPNLCESLDVQYIDDVEFQKLVLP